ncbi:ATP-dependent DNA helicase [Perkinsela sp. CCAP 1560/4]|nr:ATP-dependent DNA helicase [Perkinsela sp. CCAP 1560/4]KNH09057.1 ATP-dependent DNA helicase [Perkinsela sp. CCAP 1560/4]|eukprot:KNH06784.1 ATP-dependent DNA helicase [Perkinsela sp. CCAP 1560/4]
MSVPDIKIGNSIATDDLLGTDRVGIHSHIHGLGLDDQFHPLATPEGLIGQIPARRAAGIAVKMVREGKIAGRCVLIAGPPSTGKTALGTAMAHTLGPHTPFNMIAASEVFSLEMSKTEALTQAFRRSIAVKLTEESDVIEGEVTAIDVERPSTDPTIAKQKSGSIILKTTDMESTYDLGGKLIDALEKEHVHVGDVVTIDRGNGKVTRIGRSFSHAKDYDIQSQSTRFIACPQGELARSKSVAHCVSLHEVDVINSRPQGYRTLFAGDTGEISAETRDQIDEKIAEWKAEGRAQIIPGVLFIDEVHMLDIECFSWLNRALESALAPLVVMATNRETSAIRGSTYVSPYGIPIDLLDRTLIISTSPYSPEEIRTIITLRANEENIGVDPDALEELTAIARRSSLRYSLQLLTTGSLASARENRERVSIKDVKIVADLFLDLQQSTEYLKEHASEYAFGSSIG